MNMQLMRYVFVLIGVLTLTGIACRQSPKADISAIAHSVHLDPFMQKRLESEMVQHRKDKDEYFKTQTDSPLPSELRPVFQGLEYYPLNWKYRFEGPVQRYANPQKFTMITTSGELRDAVKYGYIQFELENKNFKLEVYRLLDLQDKNLLFVPFIDANVGKETYPAGRYIDLVEKPNGLYVIDFNGAYNPSCAYGGKYPCPVTPAENQLPIAIPAGEKILPLAAKFEEARKNETAVGS